MNKFKKVYILIFLILIIFSFLILIILNKRAMPVIMNYANVQTKKVGIEVLRNTGIRDVNKLLKNKELYVVSKNIEGEIESIDFNTQLINESMIIISKNVRKRLKDVEKGRNLPEEMYDSLLDKKLKKGIIYEVPVGIIFNNAFLSNLGPKIPVKVKYSGNVGLDVKTRGSAYGLNSA